MKKLILSNKRLSEIISRVFKWYFNYYIKRQPRPLVLSVFTTNACNFRCDICSIWRSDPKATISLAKIKNLIDANSGTACYISLSGGEPLLVPDIMGMVAYASSKIPFVHLVSNGLLISPGRVKELKSAGLTEVSLSLDGNREWHNRTHGSDKSYDGVINAIECFKTGAPEIKVSLDTVIYPDAPGEARKAAEISKRLGIFHKFQPVNKHFDFEASLGRPPDIDLSGNNAREVDDLIEYLISSPHVLNSRYFLKQIPKYFAGKLVCGPIRPRCVLPYFYLEVSAYGNVSPCMYATGWNGILGIDSGLRDNLNGKEYSKCLRDLERCRLCDRAMFMCYWEPLIQFPLMHSIVYGARP